MKNLVLLPVCLVLLASVAPPIAADDLTIVSTVTTGKKGKSTTATQYLAGDKVRTSDGVTDTIFDISTGRMVHVDHKKEQYWETTLAEMREQFAELERMLDENPMMAKMLGTATEVQVTRGSETREIAGYVCDRYSLTIGKILFELWAARDLKAPAEYYDAQKMAYAMMGPTATRFDKLYEEMKKVEGFPLRTEMDSRMMGLKLKSVSEATEVRKGPIPPDTFEPPAGYKQTKSPYEKK